MDLQKEILSIIKDYPDFPKPGIIFKDICPLLAHPRALKRVVRQMAEHAEDCKATQILGVESRGFLFGVPLALPGPIASQSYDLEYGTDHIEIQKSALADQARNLIVDDVIATGGTAQAVGQLIQNSGSIVAGYSFLLELSFLNGRQLLKKIAPNAGFYSIVVI